MAELPPGFVPYLIVDGAADAIDFYVRAFGAQEEGRLEMPDGKIGHAAVTIDGAALYLADETEDMAGGPTRAPRSVGATTVIMHRYVPDVDAAVARAEEAGATVLREPEDQFYGDRASVVADPWGHQWSLHTKIRDVSMEEMQAAMEGSGG